MSFIRDTYLIFNRSLQITVRNPVWIIFGMFQPLCFLLLFAPLLEKISGNPAFGAGNSLTVFTPGLLIMIALYGCAFVGFGLIDDIRSGVIERMYVTPINRTALLLGRVLRDLVVLCTQALFLIGLAWILGLSANWMGIALSLPLVFLVGFTAASASYMVAALLQNEDALAPLLNFFLLPLQLLAGITLPLTLAPNWLVNLAFFNPLSHAVSAARALFIGAFADASIPAGFIAMTTVAAIAFWSSSRVFARISR